MIRNQSTKSTPEQMQFHVKFCQNHPEIVSSKDKILTNKLWEELVTGLNGLNGPKKTVRKWKQILQKSQLKWDQLTKNCGNIVRLELGTLGIPEDDTSPLNCIERLDLGTLGVAYEDKKAEDSLTNPLEIIIKTEDDATAVEEMANVGIESVKNPVDLLQKHSSSVPLLQKSAPENPLNSELDNPDSDAVSKSLENKRKRRHSSHAKSMASIFNLESRAMKREKRQEKRDQEFISTLKGLTNNIDELINVMKNTTS